VFPQMQNNMRILGIDPGYERLGIAIVEKRDGKEILVYSSCFKTSSSDPFPDRLHAIGREIERVINQYKPEALSIETLFFNTNQKTAMRVAETRGVIIHESSRGGLSIHEYTPLQIKIALTGYGRADKNQISFMLGKLLSLDATKKIDDECDAIAAALTHSASCR